MKWEDIAPLIASAAPTIGSLLGGLIPFPGGQILGSVAGKVVAEALGVPPTPDAVGNAITAGDPAIVQAKLSEAETKMNAEVEKFKAQLQDVQDARATGVQYAQIGSRIQWAPSIVSSIVCVGFFGTLLFLLKGGINFTDTVGQVLLILIGSLVSYMNQVVNFWLGSSAGSANKDLALQTIAGAQKQTVVKK